MNEHALRTILEGGGGPAGRLLRAVLWTPGKAYGLAMRLRRMAYKHGLMASTRVPVPVISIGNLTAGGSGKTPLALFVANELLRKGRTPAILMRGYRAEAGHSDEADLYAKRAPGAILAINPDRRAGAAGAIAGGADVLLLDDGLQHLKLQRDIDIVLVDATAPWGGGNTLPGGLLREPRSALDAAGAVVVTRSDQIPPPSLDALVREIRSLVPGTPVFTARHRPARLARLDDSPLPLDSLKGKNAVALSGIARPEAFRKTLACLGASVVGAVEGRDHDAFTQDVVLSAVRMAKERNAVVVVTEKDRARRIFADPHIRKADKESTDNDMYGSIWTLGIEQDIDGKDAFIGLLAAQL